MKCGGYHNGNYDRFSIYKNPFYKPMEKVKLINLEMTQAKDDNTGKEKAIDGDIATKIQGYTTHANDDNQYWKAHFEGGGKMV